MKEFNRKLIEEFRSNNGQLSGPLAGRQIMLLTTKGARTGQDRTVVIGYRPAGDKFVVIASANGAPADPAWYRYVVEHGQGLICMHDLDGVLLFINPAAARALGYEPHQGLGKKLSLFLAPTMRPLFGA